MKIQGAVAVGSSAVLAFAQFSDVKLSTFAQTVSEVLTGNVNFPTPAVLPAALSTALAVFTEALAMAAQGGKQQAAEKNAKRVAQI